MELVQLNPKFNNQGTLLIEILDTNNQDTLCKYEKLIYELFHTNKVVLKLWDWDHEKKRVNTRIPYKDQLIYVLLNEANAFCASIAVNYSTTERQYIKVGFSKEIESNSCEVFAMFLNPKVNVSIFTIVEFLKLCVINSSKLNTSTTSIKAICSPKTYPLYRRLGFVIVETKKIEEETRYFIELRKFIDENRTEKFLLNTV